MKIRPAIIVDGNLRYVDEVPELHFKELRALAVALAPLLSHVPLRPAPDIAPPQSRRVPRKERIVFVQFRPADTRSRHLRQ